jgi:hypothetical protein
MRKHEIDESPYTTSVDIDIYWMSIVHMYTVVMVICTLYSDPGLLPSQGRGLKWTGRT